jgi:hypothetical protein
MQQKLSGSSFVGGYLSGIHAHFDSIRLTVIDTQILRWRGFDEHMPACNLFEKDEIASSA